MIHFTHIEGFDVAIAAEYVRSLESHSDGVTIRLDHVGYLVKESFKHVSFCIREWKHLNKLLDNAKTHEEYERTLIEIIIIEEGNHATTNPNT